MQSQKAWICLIVIPVISLLPDITYLLAKKIFWPSPTDAVMMKQSKNPDYVYEGFSNVFIPKLPENIDPAKKSKFMEIQEKINAKNKMESNQTRNTQNNLIDQNGIDRGNELELQDFSLDDQRAN